MDRIVFESALKSERMKLLYRQATDVEISQLDYAIIISLEKQIPCEPNGEYCPKCKRHLRKPKVSCGYTGKTKRRNGDNYCPGCGQAIEWEEQS